MKKVSVFYIFLFYSSFVLSQDIETDEDQASQGGTVLKLQSTFIGDKEQPSVSYFIPWQGTDGPDNLRWKIERKNDDTLSVVDRNIMLRSIKIYNELNFETQ